MTNPIRRRTRPIRKRTRVRTPTGPWYFEATKHVERVASGLGADVDPGDYHLITLTNVYLVACMLYYEHDAPFMDDGPYDGLCRYLHEHYDDMAAAGVWWLGKVIVRENLEAGSCVGVEYPKGIRDMVDQHLIGKGVLRAA